MAMAKAVVSPQVPVMQRLQRERGPTGGTDVPSKEVKEKEKEKEKEKPKAKEQAKEQAKPQVMAMPKRKDVVEVSAVRHRASERLPAVYGQGADAT